MSRKFNNFISVMCSWFRFIVLKLFNMNSFYFKGIERFSPNVVVEKERNAKLYLGNKVRAHSNVKIKIRNGAELIIHDNVSFNYNCMIICRNRIEIQEGVEFGPNVLIYDHDHDYKCENGIKAGKYKCSPVSIGRNTWIGANSVVLRGTTIGENCVIGAGCVVKGNIPDGTTLIQKRENIVLHVLGRGGDFETTNTTCYRELK